MHDNLPLVCFIVCDSGPATHFAAFAKSLLVGSNLRINIYASGPALEKFQTLNLSDDICLFQFILNELNNEEEEEELAIKLIDSCLMEGAQTIIVDIGNKFDIKLQEAYNKLDLALHNIHFWCYYDNPEEYVPGGYSIRSEEMIKLSKNVLFANINLVKRDSKIFSLPNIMINFNNKNIQGIGYYPTDIAENLKKRREIERQTLRAKYGWNNIKYLFVYFGGNNKIYYNQAFPAFLSFLSQIDNNILEDIMFLIHQHPAAKKQNHDGLLFHEWLLKNNHIQAMLSQLTSDEAQIIADGVLYYQTSMGPQFILIGLPVIQVGHEICEDILIKHNLCETAANAIELMNELKVLKSTCQLSNNIQQKQLIYGAIGYTVDWSENLRNTILDLE